MITIMGHELEPGQSVFIEYHGKIRECVIIRPMAEGRSVNVEQIDDHGTAFKTFTIEDITNIII